MIRKSEIKIFALFVAAQFYIFPATTAIAQSSCSPYLWGGSIRGCQGKACSSINYYLGGRGCVAVKNESDKAINYQIDVQGIGKIAIAVPAKQCMTIAATAYDSKCLNDNSAYRDVKSDFIE